MEECGDSRAVMGGRWMRFSSVGRLRAKARHGEQAAVHRRNSPRQHDLDRVPRVFLSRARRARHPCFVRSLNYSTALRKAYLISRMRHNFCHEFQASRTTAGCMRRGRTPIRARPVHRRVRQRRRGGHPGRPEDLRRPGLLRNDRHHGHHRPEHAGRTLHPRSARRHPGRPDRRGGGRHRRGCRQDRHAACSGGRRGGGRRDPPARAAPRGARPRHGGHQRRSPHRAGHRARAGEGAVSAGCGGDAEPRRGGHAAGPRHPGRERHGRRGAGAAGPRRPGRAAQGRPPAGRRAGGCPGRAGRGAAPAPAVRAHPDAQRPWHGLHAVVRDRRPPGPGQRTARSCGRRACLRPGGDRRRGHRCARAAAQVRSTMGMRPWRSASTATRPRPGDPCERPPAAPGEAA